MYFYFSKTLIAGLAILCFYSVIIVAFHLSLPSNNVTNHCYTQIYLRLGLGRQNTLVRIRGISLQGLKWTIVVMFTIINMCLRQFKAVQCCFSLTPIPTNTAAREYQTFPSSSCCEMIEAWSGLGTKNDHVWVQLSSNMS